ncbi:MAG: hypothetical protein K9G33_04040 [Sneathiella sp.]|nr:hypothetical protein [Sneathiella sp.]
MEKQFGTIISGVAAIDAAICKALNAAGFILRISVSSFEERSRRRAFYRGWRTGC